MKHMIWIAAVAVMMSSMSSSEAGLFRKKKCDTDCAPVCCEPTCCPDDYRCKLEVTSEPIEKSCYNVDAEAICIPPIMTSPFDCFRKKICGKGDCCDSGCCNTCDGGGCCKKGGLFSCFKGKCCGKIRCINVLSKEKYECGEKCVCEWSAECVGCCGCGDACCDGGCGACCDSCSAPAACCPIR